MLWACSVSILMNHMAYMHFSSSLILLGTYGKGRLCTWRKSMRDIEIQLAAPLTSDHMPRH